MAKKIVIPLSRFFAEAPEIDEHVRVMKDSMKKAGMVRKPIDTKVFDSVSQGLYHTLYNSCKKLCEDYESRGIFSEDVENKRIQITIKNRGLYELWVDKEKQFVYFFSPASGTHRYWYEDQNEVWLSEEDLHNLLERFARELMPIGPINI